jgi:hypothetical protein
LQSDTGARAPSRGYKVVVPAIAAAAVVYIASAAGSLVLGEPGAAKAWLRLLLLVGLGAATLQRMNWARWVLVGFLAIWSVEQVNWASQGALTGFVAAPVFVASAIALASRSTSRFVKGSA